MKCWTPLSIAELTPADRNSILIWLGVIFVAVIIGGLALLLFRRRILAQEAGDHSSEGGFLLSDLRKMRDRGEITAEEYELTRARVVAKVKAKANETVKPKAKRDDRDVG